MKTIKKMAAKELEENQHLDIVIVRYPEKGDIEIEIYYTKALTKGYVRLKTYLKKIYPNDFQILFLELDFQKQPFE